MFKALEQWQQILFWHEDLVSFKASNLKHRFGCKLLKVPCHQCPRNLHSGVWWRDLVLLFELPLLHTAGQGPREVFNSSRGVVPYTRVVDFLRTLFSFHCLMLHSMFWMISGFGSFEVISQAVMFNSMLLGCITFLKISKTLFQRNPFPSSSCILKHLFKNSSFAMCTRPWYRTKRKSGMPDYCACILPSDSQIVKYMRTPRSSNGFGS